MVVLTRALVLILALAASGCVLQPPARTPARAVAVVELAPREQAPDEATLKALAGAQTAVLEAEQLRPWSGAARALLDAADAALARGQGSVARDLAQRAAATAAADAHTHYQFFAADYLQRAGQFALLHDEEAGILRAAEVASARGDARRVYWLLRPLVRHFYTATNWYTVRPGQTLADIAGRAEIFDNPLLWPLLFRDNKGLVRDPRRLVSGWSLRVRRHPMLAEIFAAAEYAQQREQVADPVALDRLWLSP